MITLIKSETNNNPITAPNPITLSIQLDPVAVMKVKHRHVTYL